MTLGSKRTLIARLIAGAGAFCGILGFTMSATTHEANLAAFPWFAGGTLFLVLAIYLLTYGAAAFPQSPT